MRSHSQPPTSQGQNQASSGLNVAQLAQANNEHHHGKKNDGKPPTSPIMQSRERIQNPANMSNEFRKITSRS